MKNVFFFAPHQDDELTNLGAAICADIDAGNEVFCVLCTDGGASGARLLIGDNGACAWHEGDHVFPMSRDDFSAARDREFIASCLAMGLKRENIIVSPCRGKDSSLKLEEAEKIILDATASFPPESVVVKTLYPLARGKQNPDHTALGMAAKQLFSRGCFSSLELYYEMILLPADDVQLFTMIPAPSQREKLLAACAEYGLWAPEAGRFAVGRHSVFDEFSDFERKPFSYLVKSL